MDGVVTKLFEEIKAELERVPMVGVTHTAKLLKRPSDVIYGYRLIGQNRQTTKAA